MKVEIPNQLLVKVSGMVSRGIKEAEINEYGILVFTLTDGTKIELGSVKGDQGPRGESGVYVGTGEMPEGCNVQIDPSGEAFEFIQPPKTASIGQALLVKSIDETGKPTEWETGEVTGGTGGTSDHSKLSNRDAADQHPISSITGLEEALTNKQPTDSFIVTLTQDGEGNNTVDKTFAEIVEAIQSNRATYLYSENMYLPLVRYYPESYVAFGFAATGSDSVSSSLFAIFSNDHVEIKKTVLKSLPNPNALTFTGAVTGSYDGSEPVTVNIPSGGGGVGSISLPLLYDLTTTEEVSWIDTGDNAYTVNSFLVVELVSIATTSNEADGDGSASMYPIQSGGMQTPWTNFVIENKISALLPKTYDKVFRAFCFRGEDGHWSSITAIRNDVNPSYTAPRMITVRSDGVSDQPMRGLIIGKSWEAKSNVLGVGSRLRVWGI